MWRRRLADLSMLTTESLALFVLGAALGAAGNGEGPSFITVFMAMLGGFYLVRFLVHFDTGRTALIGAAIAVTALALLVLLNLQYDPSAGPLSLRWVRGLADDPEGFLAGKSSAVFGVLLVTFAWFRAVSVAQRELTYVSALASYTVGLLLVVVLLLFGEGSRARTGINAAALPYLMLGLLTLSLVHLSRAEYQQGDLLRGPWLPTLVITIGALALIAGVVGLFPLDALNTLLAPVGMLALRILDLVILVIALPLALLVAWLIRLVTGRDKFELPPPRQAASDAADRLQEQAQQGGPPEFIVVLTKALFLLALLAAVAYGLWHAYRWLRRPLRGNENDETREWLREGGLGDDLGALLGGLLGRFRRPPSEREPALPEGVLAVRRLYVRALERAAAAGAARPPGSTPAEFAPTLVETLHTPAAATLSDRFAAARYGLVVPLPGSLAEVEREIRRA